MPSGLHGELDFSGGSFSTASAAGGLSYAERKNRFFLNADGFHTRRYLDPPVLANFTNTGNSSGFEAVFERDLSELDRVRISFAHRTVNFLVPNELVQQQAGQRQNISDQETAAQIDFQHAVSTRLLFTFAGSIRNAGSALSSNASSTPVIVSQDRGYTEGYVRADVAAHSGHQDWKFGIDSLVSAVHENLQYAITDPTQFDPATQKNFQFAERKGDFEPSFYAQDQSHFRNWNLSAGARFDHYDFVVRQSAFSPRLGVSHYFPSLNLLVHASYDRIFQTPAMENLLLASSPLLDSVNPIVVRLPVQPAHANYYEFGFTKTIFGRLRLDSNIFRRDFRNYSDDDVLLDTGVSFPIAFTKATIKGEEVSLQLPNWGRFSGTLSYSNQSGAGQGPITGGLFLGSDAASLSDTSRFPVTQDQRNTLRFSTRSQLTKKIWVAGGVQYGSGLPAESDGEAPTFLLAQFGPEILSRVNFDRERVRPNFAIDWEREWNSFTRSSVALNSKCKPATSQTG
ncbi:MAG TPA: TonB-dependent receptor [Candidatus Angelobacter sp.]|nr:TonB-dependent receptor [Candidatus Angelobacter sp.]